MQLTVKKTAIESAAKKLSKVIDNNNAMPILTCILCEVADHKLTMTASDSEIDMIVEVGLEEMEGDGRFCVDAGRLVAALEQLTDQPLTITATTESDNRFTIKHRDGETFFAIQGADEFPTIQAIQYDATAVIDGKPMRDAIKRCLWTTAQDELRPVMNGVYLCTNEEGYIDIVASDGQSLVRSTLVDPVESKISAIIPKKAAKILADLLDECPNTLRFAENNMQAELLGTTITIRLISGNYPNYNGVIPTDSSKEASVDGRKMSDCVKSVLPFAPDSSNLVTMEFQKDKLTMRGEDLDFGEGASNSIELDGYDGDPITIGVKGSTIVKVIKAMPAGNMIVKMTDSSRAIIFEPEEELDDADVLMLCMPMLTISA